MQKPQPVPRDSAPEAPTVASAEERKWGFCLKSTTQNAGVSRFCLYLGFPGADPLNLLEQVLNCHSLTTAFVFQIVPP